VSEPRFGNIFSIFTIRSCGVSQACGTRGHSLSIGRKLNKMRFNVETTNVLSLNPV